MELVVRTVLGDVDFVNVNRDSPGYTVLTFREGMSTRSAFVSARILLTDPERDLLRARYGGPTVAECPEMWCLDDLVPFVSQSWLNPEWVTAR